MLQLLQNRTPEVAASGVPIAINQKNEMVNTHTVIIPFHFSKYNKRKEWYKIMAEGVRKRGKTWSYYFDAAKIGGERKKIEKGGFRTQKEAAAARAKAIAEYNETGRTFSPNDMSVSDYLDYWLENVIKKNIDHGYAYQTYKGYRQKIDGKIKPAFGKYKLSSFQYSPDIVQSWIDDLKIKGHSRYSIKGYLGCLSSAMGYAILPLKYIQTNPCTPVKIGKMPVDLKARELNGYICSKEDFAKIMERFPCGNKYHLSFVVPYYTGTRIGETFAIDLLHDVNFELHEISINKQLVKIGPDWCFRPPKYDSYRTLKIGTTLEKDLKDAIRQRKEFYLKYGQAYLKTYVTPDNKIRQLQAGVEADPTYKEIMPLCTSPTGKIITPWTFPNCCGEIIRKQLGIELFHAHCLRHTHGTILAENGVNPKTVMERLGHKDIATTLGTYTFNTDSMQKSAVEIFEKVVNK